MKNALHMKKHKPKLLKPKLTPEQLKRMRGIKIAESGGVEFLNVDKWRVKGHEKPYYYVIRIGEGLLTCTCPDFDNRGFIGKTSEDSEIELPVQPLPLLDTPDESQFIDCKHIIAVRFIIDNGDNKLI
jgi:hypothetical protein